MYLSMTLSIIFIVSIFIISISSLIAALTFFYSKRNKFAINLRNEKLNLYKMLITSISDLIAEETDKEEANKRFATVVNTLALIAPRHVMNTLMLLNHEFKFRFVNPERYPEDRDKLLKRLLIFIRNDIGLTNDDDCETFNFRLISEESKGSPGKPSINNKG